MCGIAGIQLQQGYKPDPIMLDAFAKALHHRGPDDSGIEIYDHTAFVHTRLSIIDLAHGCYQERSKEICTGMVMRVSGC